MHRFKLLLLSILFLNSETFAMKNPPEDSTTPKQIGPLSLPQIKEIGEKYITFMNHAGGREHPADQSEINQLFAPELTKIENVEKVLFMKSSGLLDQIKDSRAAVGTWAITKLEVIPSEQACVVYYKWKAERMPDIYTTMAILTLNKEWKITRIEEVYNKVNAGF